MVIGNPATLGALIRDRRRKLGLEQKALAETIGVSRHWIIDVEKGRPGAEIGLTFRALRALGIRLHTGEETAHRGDAIPDFDLDAIIENARKPRR